MKNKVIWLLAFLPTISTAQVYKFRAVQFVCTRFQNQPMEPPEYKDLKDMPMEWSVDSSTLTIHSPNIQVFHIDPDPIVREEKDSVVRFKFNAVDNHGVKCLVTHEIYESEKAPHFADFWLEYPDKTYMYYVENL